MHVPKMWPLLLKLTIYNLVKILNNKLHKRDHKAFEFLATKCFELNLLQ